MGNDQVRKSLKRILSEIPCAVKDNGKSFSACFERIDYSSIKNTISEKKGNISYHYIVNKNNSINSGKFDFDNSLKFDLIYTNNDFKENFENYKENSNQSYFLVAKKILYTVEIPPNIIKFKESYRDNFGIYKLDDLFSETGYKVPLKIEIGGLFLFNDTNHVFKQFNNLNFNSSTEFNLKQLNNKNNISKISKSNLEKIFSSGCLEILGGDTSVKDLEKWETTVSIYNAEIIGYQTLEDITKFIPSNYRDKLKADINYLKIKFTAREKYIYIYNDVKDAKATFDPTLPQAGYLKENKYPSIRVEKFECKRNGKFMSFAKGQISAAYLGIIVGYKIIDKWADGTNGKWKINSCPLLSKSININFVSQWFRGEHFGVEIYIMDMPE